MTEDFSHADWSNGVNDGDNGWIVTNEADWTFSASGGNSAPSIFEQDTQNRAFHFIAKTHNLGTAAGTNSYVASFDVSLDTRSSLGMLLLGDQYGNGYAIRYNIASGGARNLSVYETSGGDNAFGGTAVNFSETLLDSTTFATVSLGGTELFYSLNMKLSQSSVDQTYTITAWVDGISTEESPSLTISGDVNATGHDLADLTYIGFTSQKGVAGSNLNQFDNIYAGLDVVVIPEPATAATLLGFLSIAMVFCRRRV